MSLSVTALISKDWKRRMWLMMAAAAGLGGWFLFDGLIAYPRHNQWASVYFELAAVHGKDTPELAEAWRKTSAGRNRPEDTPKKEYTSDEIQTQIILGALAWAAALAVFIHYRRSLPRLTRLEDGRIFLPDGREIPVSSVRAMSKRRWESKGIADFAYEPSPGRRGKFLIDDYKYAGADQIVAEIEKRLVPADPGNPPPPGQFPES